MVPLLTLLLLELTASLTAAAVGRVLPAEALEASGRALAAGFPTVVADGAPGRRPTGPKAAARRVSRRTSPPRP